MSLPPASPLAFLRDYSRPPRKIHASTLELTHAALLNPAAPFPLPIRVNKALDRVWEMWEDGFGKGM